MEDRYGGLETRAERVAYCGTLVLYGVAMIIILALVVFAFGEVNFILKL